MAARPFVGRPGQRIYWHGVFPNPSMVGTIVATGTMRHEVRWDHAPTRTSLESVDALQAISQYVKCDCGRCGK